MQVPATERRSVCFGRFRVDFASRELLNDGSKIPLQDKPFQVLSLLVDHHGELVSREELRQKLWPSHTFVDFDHSINTAIKKLREALADDAEEPRFIETLPRRGYRFIGLLNASSPLNDTVVHYPEQTLLPVHDCKPHQATLSYASVRLVRWPKRRTISLTIVLCVASLGLWVQLPYPPPRILGSRQITNDGLQKRSLVSDGNAVYFNEIPAGAWNGSWSISQVSMIRGEPATLSLPLSRPVLSDISPAHSELLVGEEPLVGLDGPYYSARLPAGTPLL